MTQVVAVVPDYIGGIVARIKAYQPTVDKVETRVATALGSKWIDHTYAVLVRRAGAAGEDTDTRRFFALVDTFWYGPSEYEAYQLWAAAHRWICPDGIELPNTYRPGPAGLVFDTVMHLAGPLFQVEEASAWPYMVSRYIFTFSTVPIP